MAMDAWMLVPGWVRGESTPESMGVSLETVANHIDHICQLTGSAAHVGIGTDLLDRIFSRHCICK
jgi:membrane dipeptidase